MLKLTDALTSHLRIDGFTWALLGALMMSALGTVGQWLLMRGMLMPRGGDARTPSEVAGGVRAGGP